MTTTLPPAPAAKPLLGADRTPAEHGLVHVFILVPFLALIAAVPFAWGWGLTWLDIELAAGFYVVTGLAVTIGFHRHFTHGAFKAARPLRIALAALGIMAVQGPVTEWVADHRRHHAFSDRDGDPHSPWRYGTSPVALTKGFWHAHLGWIFDRGKTNLDRFAPDLVADRDIVAVDRLFVLWTVLTLGLPPLLAGLITWSWWGAVTGLFWAGSGADLVAAPRDLVGELGLSHDRRPPVRLPGQGGELLAAGDPVVRRVLAQLPSRRSDVRPPWCAAWTDRHLRARDPGLRETGLGMGCSLAHSATTRTPDHTALTPAAPVSRGTRQVARRRGPTFVLRWDPQSPHCRA